MRCYPRLTGPNRAVDAQALEARRAIYAAGRTWKALREKMRYADDTHIAGFSTPRELLASSLAQAITSDGYLAGYIANRLLEGN